MIGTQMWGGRSPGEREECGAGGLPQACANNKLSTIYPSLKSNMSLASCSRSLTLARRPLLAAAGSTISPSLPSCLRLLHSLRPTTRFSNRSQQYASRPPSNLPARSDSSYPPMSKRK